MNRFPFLALLLTSVSAFALPTHKVFVQTTGAKAVIESYTASTYGRYCFENGNSSGEFSFGHDLDRYDAAIEGNINWEEGGDLAFQISYDTGSCKATCSLKHQSSDTSVFIGATGSLGGFGCDIDDNGDFWLTYKLFPKRGVCIEGSASPRDYRVKISVGLPGGSAGCSADSNGDYLLWIEMPRF